MITKWLFKHTDNSSLIVFRIIFGLLCFLESVGAILTGWVNTTLVSPKFTFNFIGLEWLQPLPGNGMYFYYLIMGIFALLVMFGYKYRLGIIGFTLLWAGTYFMQKASYNNHYYLLILLSAIMALQPANKYFSIDAKLNPNIKSISMPQWCKGVFILQMFIVYTYASVAKIYPDWLDTTVMEILMRGKKHYIIVGELLQNKTLHYILAYGGILFDGLIIPLLLYKPTRKVAFILSIFFHLFNSFIFQVGIFPYLSLAFALFFFDPKVIHKLFLKQKPFYKEDALIIPSYKTPFLILFGIYFLIQIGLPLRHNFIKDNVLWTEEGHRLSWRMMLRAKHGIATFKVFDKKTEKTINIKLSDYLTKKQQRLVTTKPDVIWQFAQHLKQSFNTNGQDVSVFVNCRVKVNGKPYKQLINPKTDLANIEWQTFKHSDWILPSKQD
ncbi:HTTM domain-containing protein [Postechiella marina]